MHLQDLRRWHWLILGAAVGLLFALAWSLAGPSPDGVRRYPITEEDLASLLTDDEPGAVRDLVLSPDPDDPRRTYVTGELMTRRHGYVPFALYTSGPFPPEDPHPAADVRAYVERLRAGGRAVPLVGAWWEAAWFRLGWPTAAGAVLIGGVWPVVLNLMTGAGLGGRRAARGEGYDLERVGRQGEAADPRVPGGEGAEVLDDAAGVGAGRGEAVTEAVPAVVASPVPVPLNGGPVEPAPVADDPGPKEYQGEFYPVAKPSSHLAPPRGFSLVELLVVIGIIGIVMGLLLPALVGARRSASVVACASNLRQISYALQAYLNDHRGVVFWRGPALQGDGMDWYAYGGRETGNANHDTGDYFNAVVPRPLNRYVGKGVRVFHCPNDTVAPWTSDPSAYTSVAPCPVDTQFDWVGNSYNFNANGYPLRPFPRHDGGLDGVKMASVHGASHVIVFYEACLYWGGDWHYRRKANVAYADAHVSFLPLPP